MIEKEIKLEVATREDFERAIAYFADRSDKATRDTLVNHYLDTEHPAHLRGPRRAYPLPVIARPWP